MTRKKATSGKSKERRRFPRVVPASEQVPATPPTDTAGIEKAESRPDDHQRYATFTLELLINEDDTVRRTHILHVQSREEQTWAGWDEAAVTKFITRRAELRSTPSGEEALEALFGPLEAAISETASLQPIAAVFDRAGVGDADTDASHASELRLSGLVISGAEASNGASLLNAGQPYLVRLTLDLPKSELSAAERTYHYYAVVQGKQLGGQERRLVARGRGTLTITSLTTHTIELTGVALPRGLYRLEWGVRLAPLGGQSLAALDAWLEGGLLQVY